MGLKIGKASVPIVADAQDFRYPHPHPRMHSVCTRMQGFRLPCLQARMRKTLETCLRRIRVRMRLRMRWRMPETCLRRITQTQADAGAYVSACVCACVCACLRLACAA
jgi:hypothetical protein